jgi:hypothetical protein
LRPDHVRCAENDVVHDCRVDARPAHQRAQDMRGYVHGMLGAQAATALPYLGANRFHDECFGH